MKCVFILSLFNLAMSGWILGSSATGHAANFLQKHTSFLLWLTDVSLSGGRRRLGSHAGHAHLSVHFAADEHHPQWSCCHWCPRTSAEFIKVTVPLLSHVSRCLFPPSRGNWGLGGGGGRCLHPEAPSWSAQRPVLPALSTAWPTSQSLSSSATGEEDVKLDLMAPVCIPSDFSVIHFSRHFPMMKDFKKDKNVLNFVPWKDNASLVKNDKRW